MTVWPWFALPAAAGLAVWIVSLSRKARRLRRLLRATAERLSLSQEHGTWVGRRDDFRVTLWYGIEPVGGMLIEICIDGGGAIPRRFEAAPAVGGISGWGRERTGDAAFDREVLVGGPPELVSAFLDSERRESLRAVVARGARVAQGRLEHALRDDRIEDAAQLADLVEEQVASAGRLRFDPADTARRLADNVRREPLLVRRQCFLRLAAAFPDEPACRDAARVMLADDDPGIALRAARLLGREGAARLAELVRHHKVSSHDRRQALSGLVELATADGGDAALEAAAWVVRTSHESVELHDSLKLIRTLGGDAYARVATEFVDRFRSEEAALVNAVAAWLEPELGERLEPSLLERLRTGPAADSSSLLEALGHIGGERSVGPLAAAVAAGDAAATAIREIEARRRTQGLG